MAGTRRMHYTARAGEFVVMAELASRGYNVAKAEVDTPDDVIAIDDEGARLVRLQVKTAIPRSGRTGPGKMQYEFSAHYPGLMSQRPAREQDLFFIFVMVDPPSFQSWTAVILPRARLVSLVRDDGVGTHPSADRDTAHIFVEYVEVDDTRSLVSRGRGQRVSLAGLTDNWDDFFPSKWTGRVPD